ncbi:MAG: CHAT domain-containing tetratricopeptide repeat protein [Caldilineaceae bacterium]
MKNINWYRRIDPLINGFYTALRTREFATAQAAITELNQQAKVHKPYQDWAKYFTGILAEEQQRNWAEAEQHYLELLVAEIDDILRAHILLSLGVAYNNQARWQESVRVCEESAQIWQTLKYPLKHAYVTRQIALSLYTGYRFGEFGLDDLQRAAQLCQSALQVFATYDANEPEIVLYEPDIVQYQAIAAHTLGMIMGEMGDWDQAIACYQQCLDVSIARQNKYLRAFALQGLASAFQLQHALDWQQINTLYEEALALFQEVGDTYKALSVLAYQGTLHQANGKLAEASAYYTQSLGLVEQVRTKVTSVAARMGFAAMVTHIYDNAILIGKDIGAHSNLFDSMERSRARAFLDSLTIDTTTYAAQVNTEILSLSALQQLLPPDFLLLEYYTTGLLKARSERMTEQQAAHNVLYPTPKTLLLAITRDEVALYDLGFSPNTLVTDDLEQLVEERFLSTPLRQKLYDKLIAPAQGLWQHRRRVYIIPHGPLHYVPFHALIAPDGDTLLREKGPEIVYAPSATILCRALPKQSEYLSGACLAIGYNGDPGRDLHFAEEEAAYIARMANGAALVGPIAKKAALFAQAPHYYALHFSCHGEFDPDSPLESLLYIGPNETLTGQEIMDNLRLNCNLVTLSACESGLNKVQRGDELYGLLRAFMYAGAPAIIATLWRVDERSTLIFAEKFYALIQQGKAYATALKAAQLYLKNLTRRAALEILTQHMAQTGTADKQALLRQADHYLKSVTSQTIHQNGQTATADPLHEAGDDDKIFADPKFWAPFVLIGDPQMQANVDSA